MRRVNEALVIAFAIGLSSMTQAAEVTVENPYARAVPPGQPNSAVFMSLANRARDGVALIGAESPVAEVVELHTHVNEDGMMKMRRIERIELPAGETVELEPGGLHVMLIGLKETLEEGGEVPLTLLYEDGDSERILAPVRRVGMPKMPHH